MRPKHPWRAFFALAGMAGAVTLAACADDPAQPVATAPNFSRMGGGGPVFSFTGLDASATCTVAGGDPAAPFVLPAGFTQTIIAGEPAYANVPDMNTQNENGPLAGRYLYQPHEMGSGASVSVIDLVTGVTKTIAQRDDWQSLDGSAWTPWGTLLVAEEKGSGAYDPDVPQASKGLVYELTFAQGDLTTVESITARPAVGAVSHEGLRFDAQGNLYGVSEEHSGYLFRFVPDRRGDLSSGQLYALKIVSDAGNRTGEAEWVALDRDAVQVDADAAAAAAGATHYDRPEDIEIATSNGNNPGGAGVLYVAVTTEHRILAIDLREAAGGAEHATAYVYDYVARGLNVGDDFSMPDNLALDASGNLYITEDPGGSFQNGSGKTTGDDVWRATRAVGGAHQAAAQVSRFASLNDCDAEPTGIYFEKGGNRLFVNAQHRGGDGADKTVVIEQVSQ